MRAIGTIATLGLIWAVVAAQAVDRVVSPDFIPWATWGRDHNRSHYQAQISGIDRPRVRWVALGGALDEPLFDLAFLWTPQMPALSPGFARFVQYNFLDAFSGGSAGALGPYWGQAATPAAFTVPVYVVADNNLFLGFVFDWPAFFGAGGQYDSFLYAPDPGPLLDPLYFPQDYFQTVNVRPSYRGTIGAYTDGALGFAFFGDNFGAISAVGGMWIVTLSAAALQAGEIVVTNSQFFAMDDFSGFTGAAGAVLGATATNTEGLSTRVLIADHAGTLRAFDPTLPASRYRPVWTNTVQRLSLQDRVDPNNPNSPPDPIPSDAIDRPIAINADGSVAIVCASNYGRIYAVNTANGNRIWGVKLDNTRRIPIMGGPSIGPDASGNETVYVVGRFNASQSRLYALDLATGSIKWSFNLEGISRCTPTIDADGNLYIGNDRGTLFSIAPNGTLRWRLTLGGPISVAPVLIPVDLNFDNIPDPLLIVAASNRYLYAIENAPGPLGGGAVDIPRGGISPGGGR